MPQNSPSTPSRSSIVKCFLGAIVAVALFEAIRSMPETVGASLWGFGLELLGEVDSVLLVVFGALAGLGRWLAWPLWVVALGGACVLVRHGWVSSNQQHGTQARQRDSLLDAVALASLGACMVWMWTQLLPGPQATIASSTTPGLAVLVFLLSPVFVSLLWVVAMLALNGLASLFAGPSPSLSDSKGPTDVL